MLPITGILETALYFDDLDAAVAFYRHLFGFEILVRDERICAMNVAGRDVLLLFKRGASLEPDKVKGTAIGPHDGHGPVHVAFSIPAAELEAWQSRLAERGIAIELTTHWPRGGTSLYFRDPGHHLLELATPGVWAIY